jgi:hypothetical protein
VLAGFGAALIAVLSYRLLLLSIAVVAAAAAAFLVSRPVVGVAAQRMTS